LRFVRRGKRDAVKRHGRVVVRVVRELVVDDMIIVASGE
jgi:hypothetical protein